MTFLSGGKEYVLRYQVATDGEYVVEKGRIRRLPGRPLSRSRAGPVRADGLPKACATSKEYALRKCTFMQSRVRDFSWSADGGRLFYVAGVNPLDINEYHLDSLVVRKSTDGGPATEGGLASPRSEEAPTPKVLDGRDGLLFEAATEGRRRILWVDIGTREEKVLIDSAGFNSLR